jgi:hypothetical protein
MSNDGFQEGDVVLRAKAGVSTAANAKIESGTIGTICRVVNPGRSYQVRFADLPMCLLVYQQSLAQAPQGTEGPECESDC